MQDTSQSDVANGACMLASARLIIALILGALTPARPAGGFGV